MPISSREKNGWYRKPGVRKENSLIRERHTQKSCLRTNHELKREPVPRNVVYCIKWAETSAENRETSPSSAYF